jgi:hypothetical protein
MSVWLGNYSMDEKYNLDGSNNGGTFATEIIRDTFNEMYENNSPENFKKPDTIVSLPIDQLTLDEEHVVNLAGNIPERFVSIELFSSDHVPQEISRRFTKIPSTTLKAYSLKNSILLNFETFDYLDYYIYRESSTDKDLIATIKNHNGMYEYNDTDINLNTKYDYYLIVKSKYTDDVLKSNMVSIKIEKDYNSLLQYPNDNLSWLFV